MALRSTSESRLASKGSAGFTVGSCCNDKEIVYRTLVFTLQRFKYMYSLKSNELFSSKNCFLFVEYVTHITV